MGVKKWKWKERQILFCMCDEGRFLVLLFISYFFFMSGGMFFYISAKQDGKEDQLFMVFHFFHFPPFPPSLY